jgi:hypothetical protein
MTLFGMRIVTLFILSVRIPAVRIVAMVVVRVMVVTIVMRRSEERLRVVPRHIAKDAVLDVSS